MGESLHWQGGDIKARKRGVRVEGTKEVQGAANIILLCFHIPLAHYFWSKNYHRNSCRKWMKLNLIRFLGRGMGAELLRISTDQVTGMIKWGQKSKPKKIPWDSNKTAKKSLHQNSIPQKSHAEFPNHKNFPESIKWYNTKIEPFSFEYPKKSHLKSSYPKRLVPKCSYLKASWNWKFQTQKNPSIVAVIWNPDLLAR